MSNQLTPLAIYNSSYIGKKPTGIGVVARDLGNALNPKLVRLLKPFENRQGESISIPKDLSPEYGIQGHLRRLLWTQWKIPQIVKESGAQILLSPLPEAPLFKGVRSVVLAHDLLPLRHPQLSPLLAYHLSYVPLVLHRAEKILCNSDATAREIYTRLKVPAKKLITIPLGFNSNNLFNMKLEREPFFLVLGRHDPHKNISTIIKAFASLKSKEFEIWFVGPHDKRYTPKLKKLALDLKVSSRCKWVPWVSDEEKLGILNRCQALIIASLWEGFGLPALEAMACHTPVIASNLGALPEVIQDAGIIVNPRRHIEISNAMEEILSDTSIAKQFAKRADKIIEKYSWKKSASLVEEVLKSLKN